MAEKKSIPKISYSVAIRTLGTAGDKFTKMIRSLESQSIPPERIIVYIAEGYPLPQRVGKEEYVNCPKGMVHQRALTYKEITSEYLLLCDDDVLFENNSVELLLEGLFTMQGDAISPNVYRNHQWSLKEKIIQAVFHGIYPDLFTKYAFRVRNSSFFSYHISPEQVMETQCFAGACVLLKKKVFLSISLQNEIWMDMFKYPLGEDLVFAYKLYRYGYRVLIHSNCGITHQDAQTSHETDSYKGYKDNCTIRHLIWYRSIFQPDTKLKKVVDIASYYARWGFRYMVAILSRLFGRNNRSDHDSILALKDANQIIKSDFFSRIPKWQTSR